tara:strand:+ start:320 stop:523 length:204 start_codon:yes stop_codon:yes gene_type:complete
MAQAGVPVLLLMGIAGGADLVTGGRAAGDQWTNGLKTISAIAITKPATSGTQTGTFAAQPKTSSSFR